MGQRREYRRLQAVEALADQRRVCVLRFGGRDQVSRN
jgi:hypothetical protein